MQGRGSIFAPFLLVTTQLIHCGNFLFYTLRYLEQNSLCETIRKIQLKQNFEAENM